MHMIEAVRRPTPTSLHGDYADRYLLADPWLHDTSLSDTSPGSGYKALPVAENSGAAGVGGWLDLAALSRIGNPGP